ncbi:MAG: GGDEF domain-containing protein [Dehalococcoidia bacterium]
MNKPPVLNAFLFPSAEQTELGSVESSLLLRMLRPASLALWVVIFAFEAQTVISHGGGGNLLVILLSTALFAGIHAQFWYEQSEQGRRFHRALDKMRGRIYEDETTGLPNSRHFVFELRRQMMRSVRNGRGFSLLLTDFGGFDRIKPNDDRFLPAVSRTLRHAVGEGDFVAHLQGPIFAAIISDDREQTAAEKADGLLPALGSAIPNEYASHVFPIVSLSGYEGELEVRDFLRRAQRDLAGARANGPVVTPETVRSAARRSQPAVA